MSESNGSVVRIIFLYQYMTVETSHFRNCKDTDTAKALCCYRQNLTLCNVSAKFAVCSALETIEGNVARNDISFQSSLCYFFRQSSGHNHLIFHRTCCQLACCCISAVEAHKRIFLCIVVFSFDFIIVNICRNGIVNIQQSNGILADNCTDIFA